MSNLERVVRALAEHVSVTGDTEARQVIGEWVRDYDSDNGAVGENGQVHGRWNEYSHDPDKYEPTQVNPHKDTDVSKTPAKPAAK